MNHSDHVELLRPGVEPGVTSGSVWAEFGAGDGAFTLALAALLGSGTIHTIDQDSRALSRGAAAVRARYPNVTIAPQTADFTRPLTLPPLDGLLMANALHFVADKEPLLARLVGLLKPGGRFLLVEYNVDRGNHWVPYPLSFETWVGMAERVGLSRPVMLGRRGSRFLNEIYSAVARKGG